MDQTTENISFPAKDAQLYFVDNREEDRDIIRVVLLED